MTFTAKEKRQLRAAREHKTVTAPIPLVSGLGAHRVPNSTVVFEARKRGFDVSHWHDGGWITRNHVVTISGDAVKVTAFVIAVDRWLTRLGALNQAGE